MALQERLERMCAERGIDRFEPEEIMELLEDGESVDWLLAQLLPAAEPDQTGELRELLTEIAAEVGPEPAAETEPAAATDAAAEPDTDTLDPAGDEAVSGLDLEQLAGMPLPEGVDPEQMQALLQSPRGAMLADFGAFCQERNINVEAGQEGAEDLLREAHEEWLQTPREALDGRTPSAALDGGSLFPRKIETYRREAPKIGRNDPCPCGSGMKYKRCCGRGG